jgi:hypothetical protein
LYPIELTTVAENLSVKMNDVLKDDVIVLAIITVDIHKSQSLILANGKIERMEGSQLSNLGKHFTDSLIH